MKLILTLLILTMVPSWVSAQHAIDVQRLAADGEYFKALYTFDQMVTRRKTLESQIAASQAAWALGLPDRSIEEIEKVLESEQLSSLQKSQLLLSRGIIEYQEARYRVAVLYAEKVYKQFSEPHVLRGRALVLWADALSHLDSLGSAAEKYQQSLKELPQEERFDAYFHYGQCLARLGKLKQAQENFQLLPMTHERAPEALRSLAAIALDQNDYSRADFWLGRGRDNFPNSFLDSWVDYAQAKIAISQSSPKKVAKILAYAQQKYPPSDPWLNLTEAAVETFYWQTDLKEAR